MINKFTYNNIFNFRIINLKFLFIIKFIEAAVNLESLRGLDIRNCYIEQDIPMAIKNQIYTTYKPNILNIIEKP
jgi:hypothetical protein